MADATDTGAASSPTPDARGAGDADTDPLIGALRATGAFVWANLPSVVLVSVTWFICVLPIVTAGPATVGAYRAVISLRKTGTVDVDAVRTTVRDQFVHATLLGLLPVAIGAMTAVYAVTYASTGRVLAGVLALAGTYATAYVWLVLVPTFVGLARGQDAATAVTQGYLWTARHAVEAVALGVVTVAFLALSALLTVAVVLVFAGATFALHVEFIEPATPATATAHP